MSDQPQQTNVNVPPGVTVNIPPGTTINPMGVFAFQRKFFKGVGIMLMVLGGLLSLTIIGMAIGIPLILFGLLIYFVAPKFFGSMQRHIITPPGQTPPT